MYEIIDFHSHILPEIDDGSKSAEESLTMLRLEKQGGINKVILTPHFYPQRDNPEEFLKRREKAAQKLEAALSGISDMPNQIPKLIFGAEVYYFRGISDSELISKLTIDKERKKAILLEMPQIPWTDSMYREMEGIYKKRGLIPVIAHVDRYIKAFKSFADMKRLSEMPVLLQANADFFINPLTSKKAIKMLREEKIHLLGSDCHNLKERKPNLEKAVNLIKKKSGEQALLKIASYQKKVLEDW